MDCRLFLKGTVCAASMPGSALALPLRTGIFELIKQHAEALFAYNEADAAEDAILALPGKAEWPVIGPREFPNRLWWRTANKRFSWERHIDDVFDEDEHSAIAMKDMLSNGEFQRRLDRSKLDRETILGLYRERMAIYQAWKDTSGLSAANDRTSMLGTIVGELEDTIIAFRCSSLDEVHAKARFVEGNWPDGLDEERYALVVKSLIA
jgi:hypothetical protein